MKPVDFHCRLSRVVRIFDDEQVDITVRAGLSPGIGTKEDNHSRLKFSDDFICNLSQIFLYRLCCHSKCSKCPYHQAVLSLGPYHTTNQLNVNAPRSLTFSENRAEGMTRRDLKIVFISCERSPSL